MIGILGSSVRAIALGVALILATSVAAQQGYPNKPVRLIVPYPPGGGISTAARLIGQKLSEGWGHQVIVDNRGGGNTIIGTEAMVKTPTKGAAPPSPISSGDRSSCCSPHQPLSFPKLDPAS